MKTETRSHIVKIIEEKGRVRPSELHAALGLSPQAIHRHLKALCEQGIIEPRGSPPSTRYSIAGVPDFEAAFSWLSSRGAPEATNEYLSETRDVLTARLPRLKSLTKNGLSPSLLPLVVATAGEIGNNSFDHNLGQWRDTPGCWLEAQTTGRDLWVCIGDRGQGVFRSLSRVHPEFKDDQAALEAAFETVISGRSPEQRGNGLKFVRSSLSSASGRGLACVSGKGRVHYGELGARCSGFLTNAFANLKGTATLMLWRLR
jgi:DNA-binding transcriptional ArsR family regulator